MVLMNGSKRARHAASLINNTKSFGKMSGLVAASAHPPSVRRHILLKAQTNIRYPIEAGAAYQYLKEKNLLSKNPACSGGVGRSQSSRTYCACKCGTYNFIPVR